MQYAKQFLGYVDTQEEAVLTFNASKSNMKLAVHSNASYLSEPKAQSRAGGHTATQPYHQTTVPF